MGVATVASRAYLGLCAPPVSVEVDLAGGLPSLSIVGLPETSVRESKDRVRAALKNCGFEFPPRRITVNLAPADLPKGGGRFDLPIALAVLAASGQLHPETLCDHEFIGELSLDGRLRPVDGSLSAAAAAADKRRILVIPAANLDEASLVGAGRLLVADHLITLWRHLTGESPLSLSGSREVQRDADRRPPDLADVRGQPTARRALEIAAAGGHDLLMVGPPGTGKSMLAKRLPGLLPPMTESDALEAALVVAARDGRFRPGDWGVRPFRQPHHTATLAALVGGGSFPRPGEVSLAHRGVLFLDELAEFPRPVLDALRQPMEDREVTIARAAGSLSFPADFQLMAAMNPCPCGYYADPEENCRCTPDAVRRYQGKISGPLMDRLDIRITVARPRPGPLFSSQPDDDPSAKVAGRVADARERQHARGLLNARIPAQQIGKLCRPSKVAIEMLERAAGQFRLSARACHRILRVARSVADLREQGELGAQDIAEALALRPSGLSGQDPSRATSDRYGDSRHATRRQKKDRPEGPVFSK